MNVFNASKTTVLLFATMSSSRSLHFDFAFFMFSRYSCLFICTVDLLRDCFCWLLIILFSHKGTGPQNRFLIRVFFTRFHFECDGHRHEEMVPAGASSRKLSRLWFVVSVPGIRLCVSVITNGA